MRRNVSFFALLLSLFMIAGATAVAQEGAIVSCVLNDGSNSALTLTMNGEDPSDHPGHLVPTIGLTVTLEISAPSPTFYVLFASNAISCGFVPATALNDQVDTLGIGFLDLATSPKSYSASFPASVVGSCFNAAVQAVYYDPVQFRYLVTDVAQPCFAPKTITTYSDWIDDGVQMHTLTQTGADSISFGGVSYSDVYLSSNGPITFGDGTGDFSTNLGDFFDGWENDTPGVANYWGDYQRATALTDETVICEDGLTGEVTISYNNQEWWDSQTAAGSWVCTFSGNNVIQDFTGVLPGVGGTDQDAVVGVTDGSSASGTDSTVDLSAVLGSYASGSAPDSVGEQFPAGTALDIGIITFSDPGGIFSWMIN